MAYDTDSPYPDCDAASAQPVKSRQPLSWPLILGLGSLALLWPLGELTGLTNAIGELPTMLIVLAVVALVWVGSVGFSGVPHPVLTLTVTGAISGALVAAFGVVFGLGRGGAGGPAAVVGALFEIGWAALGGCLAGLIALAVQNMWGRRK